MRRLIPWLIAVPLLMGCAQGARHEYLTAGLQQALLNTDSLQAMAVEYSDAA